MRDTDIPRSPGHHSGILDRHGDMLPQAVPAVLVLAGEVVHRFPWQVVLEADAAGGAAAGLGRCRCSMWLCLRRV
jgi:hypothetical protein